MARKKGIKTLSAFKMAKRIFDRKDNVYDKKVIENILNMYMDECYKALLQGERVQITKVGTIIPEVKTRMKFSLPCCNKEEGNPPYTKIRISRNNCLCEKMNQTLLENIGNGIYGLEKLPFDKQQMGYLRNGGFIPDDIETEYEED